MVKIAVVQTDPRLAEVDANLRDVERSFAALVEQGVELAVYPECALTGYVFETRGEALAVAEPIPGPASDRLARAASAAGAYLLAGMLERDGDELYNSCVLAGPAGIEAVYRKSHTLCLGVDRFTTPGSDPYRVHELPFGRVGILICYDLRFPEPARVLALQGAQAILLPTNWPRSSHIQPDALTRARAAENRVFVVAANRAGRERTAEFLGRSQIVAPTGVVLAEASDSTTESLIADIDLAEASSKHVVVEPGVHEMDFFGDRRPELYGLLVQERRLAEIS